MGIVGRGSNRPYDCIIIEEIDNIYIDILKNIAELFIYKVLEYINS